MKRNLTLIGRIAGQLLVFVLLFSGAFPLLAQPASWKGSPPQGSPSSAESPALDDLANAPEGLLLRRVARPQLPLAGAFSSDSGWHWSHPRPQGNSLQDVQWVGSNTAYACGGYGDYSSGGSGTVLKTTDAGATWRFSTVDRFDFQHNPVAPKLTALHFRDANTGYCVGFTTSNGYFGVIYKTTDGGETWDSLNTGTMGQLQDVYFPNSQTGFAVGVFMEIFKTSDGGGSWRKVYEDSSSGSLGYLQSVQFPVDALTGYAVGGDWVTGSARSVILKTTDGGESWSRRDSDTRSLASVHFPENAQTGYVVGTWVASKTTDGGATWSPLTVPEVNFGKVHFANAQVGYASGWASAGQYHGLVVKTTNGGASWTTVKDYLYHSLNSVAFSDAQNGLAVGELGASFKTTNGGTTWQSGIQLGVGDAASQRAVSFPTARVGYVAGDYNPIFKTTDAGETWVGVTFTPIQNPSFEDIDFITPQIGHVCGKEVLGDALWGKTLDGGNTWTHRLFPSGGDIEKPIHAVTFPENESVGYLGGYKGHPTDTTHGVILKTTDGGSTWTLRTEFNLVHGSVRGLWFQNNNTGFAVGNYGLIAKTTNGGQTWTQQSSGTQVFLYNVHFPAGAQTGYACGWQSPTSPWSIIVGTTDGGSTWRDISPYAHPNYPFHLLYNGLYATGDRTCYVVGSGITGTGISDYYGLILKTTDNGATWQEFPSISAERLRDVQFPHPDTGFAAGYWQTTLRYVAHSGVGVEEGAVAKGVVRPSGFKATPNPFVSFTAILGHECERFALYDVSGRKVGTYKGDRIGEGLSAGVYFLRPEDRNAKPVRIVKVR